MRILDHELVFNHEQFADMIAFNQPTFSQP